MFRCLMWPQKNLIDGEVLLCLREKQNLIIFYFLFFFKMLFLV